MYTNADGGLNPNTKDQTKPNGDSYHPTANKKLEYGAKLITSGLVEKIYFTEVSLTHDALKNIRRYLRKYFPAVKIVANPKPEQPKESLEPRKNGNAHEQDASFSGCAALIHISWWKRLTNKQPKNEVAGRALELIYSPTGATGDPTEYLVDLLVHAAPGNNAATLEPDHQHTKALSQWTTRNLKYHLHRKSKVKLLGDLNATQFPCDRTYINHIGNNSKSGPNEIISNLPYRISPLSGIRIGEASHPGPEPITSPMNDAVDPDRSQIERTAIRMNSPCNQLNDDLHQESADNDADHDSEGDTDEITFERLSEETNLKRMMEIDEKLRVKGDNLALRGYSSTMYTNAGGGLNPFTKDPTKLNCESYRPNANNKLEYGAKLITSGLVDKIYYTEARLTHEALKRIRRYLHKYFPAVKIVAVPMSEQSKKAFELGKAEDEHERDASFSGCAALIHISW